MRLQNGQAGELAAERWFAQNGWHMVRTQPPVTILGILTPLAVGALRRFIPRLAAFGHMVVARMGKGGVPDFTGYEHIFVEASGVPLYRACECKEATGDSMPASRLDKDQRAFMAVLPVGCAWVGIWWVDYQRFEMFPFIERGAYREKGGQAVGQEAKNL